MTVLTDATVMNAASGHAKRPPTGEFVSFIRVDVRHGYYNRTGGASDLITIKPTPCTRQRLAQFHLVPRARADGIDILWSTEYRDAAVDTVERHRLWLGGLALPEDRKTAWDAFAAVTFGEPLLFTVALNDSRFLNFTALPTSLHVGDPPLLLSNRATAPADDRAAELVIDLQQTLVRPMVPVGARPDDAPRATEPALVERDQLNRTLTTFALLELHFVRAVGVPPAATWDGLPVALPTEQDISPSTYFQAVDYTLRFEPRATRWRYVVAGRDGPLDAASLTIVDADGTDAGFVRNPVPRILPDGRTACCLESAEALTILARPERHFQLVGVPLGGRSQPRILVSRLPAAGTDRISVEPLPAFVPPVAAPPATTIWSEIYVFV